MRARLLWASALLLGTASSAGANDAERFAMGRVRLTTEAGLIAGCTRIADVSDDSVKDLRRKIVRVGGDTALLTFGISDLEMIHAQVFRCARPASRPPDVPPPPPGAPPPPPPGAGAPAPPGAPPPPPSPTR
jgi:hypothetical protein